MNNTKLKTKACELLKYFTSIQTNFPDYFLYIFKDEKNIHKILNSANIKNFAESDACQPYISTYFSKIEEFTAKSNIIASWSNLPTDEFLEYSARLKSCMIPIDQSKIDELNKITEGINQSFLTVKQAYEMIGLDGPVIAEISKEIESTRLLGKD